MNTLLKDSVFIAKNMIRYNSKIIFAGRLPYFLLAAFLIFLAIVTINLLGTEYLEAQGAFELLVFIGALILFYPLTFGIQSDKDARTLEVIFGIPDYRYRVWLMRMIMIFLLCFGMLFTLGWLLSITLIQVRVAGMAARAMLPLLFLGAMSFFVSTVVKSGNATAVIMIVLGLVVLIGGDVLSQGYWDVFFNPYEIPENMNRMVWQNLAVKNQIFLISGSIVFLLAGLMNLQQREKFLD